MKNKRAEHAVSEIIGTVMLLGMAIALFSIVNLVAFSVFPENENPPSVRLAASVEDRNITIDHNGGESLPLDTEILCTVNDTLSTSITAGDNITELPPHDDNLWGISEKVFYNPGFYNPSIGSLDNSKVEIFVVDVKSNSVIMRTVIQG
jgi:flagellin-like protein